MGLADKGCDRGGYGGDSSSPAPVLRELLLAQQDLRLLEPESGTYSTVQSELSMMNVHIEDLNALLTLGNSEAIALSVQEGLGVGFVSQIVVTKLDPGNVVQIKINGLDIEREIFIGRHTRRPETAAQSAFWLFIKGMELPLVDQVEENRFGLEMV